MNKINFKLLFKQIVIPIILFIISLLVIFRWYDDIQNFQSQQIRSLINILPILPYLLFGILILLAFRENNRQLLISILLSIFSYLILTQINFPYLVNLVLDTYYIEMLLLFVGINAVILSENKRPINTPVSILILSILFFAMIIFLFLSRLPLNLHSKMFHDFLIEFPKSASWIQNVSYHFLVPFRSDKLYFQTQFPWIAIVFFLIMQFTILIKYFHKPKHYYLINFFLMLYLISSILFINIPYSSVINFNFLAITIFILLSEAQLSLAYIDELTQLPTRRKMNETMQALGSNYSIAMIDVDKFKSINDKYGHKSGDQALQLIASNLAAMKGNAKVFRFAGDEFAAIFPGKKVEEAAVFLEEFRKNVFESKFIIRTPKRKYNSDKDRNKNTPNKVKTARLSVSIGVAEKDKDSKTALKVLKKADKNLYKSKKAGRNKVSVD